MNFRRFLLIPTLLLAICGCRQSTSQVEENALFSMVPSDALAVVSFDSLGEMMTALLDSADIFRQIDYGPLSESDAVLSYCYTSSLKPVLIIDVSENEEYCHNISRQAEALGMDVRRFEGVMALGPSITLVASSERHYDESASIWDAPGFRNAVNLAGNSRNVIYLRCSGAQRWMPGKIADNVFSDKQIVSFVKTLCEWVVLEYDRKGRYSAQLSGEDSPKYFSTVIGSLTERHSDLAQLLPENAGLVMSLVTEGDFMEKYESYLDANVKLEKYKKAQEQWKREHSLDPVRLYEELGIREVALVRLDGRNMCIARLGKKSEPEVLENPYPGLMQTLFGSAFAVDDAFAGKNGEWMAFGSRQSVEAFSVWEPSGENGKAYSFIFKNEESEIHIDNNGTVIWNSNQ